MDLKQLHYFTEIVRHGNISKAAEALHMAQPPLSQSLRKLEKELNTVLIERYRSKWAVTETGKYLYFQAEQLAFQVETMKEKIAEIEKGESGVLVIGVSISCTQLCVPIIASLKKSYPDIFINVVQGDSKQLAEMLNKEEIDCAIMIKPEYEQPYDFTLLKKQPLMALISNEWIQKEQKVVTMEELSQYPFIKMGKMEGFIVNESIIDTFKNNGIQLNVEMQCRDIGLLQALVNEKIGFGIIPQIGIQPLEGTHMVEIENVYLYVEPVILYRKDRTLSKKAKRFIDIALNLQKD